MEAQIDKHKNLHLNILIKNVNQVDVLQNVFMKVTFNGVAAF